MPWQNGHHFADDIFKSIHLNENFITFVQNSLEFVPTCPINWTGGKAMIMCIQRCLDIWDDFISPLGDPIKNRPLCTIVITKFQHKRDEISFLPQLSHISFALSHQSACQYSLQNALHRLYLRGSYCVCLLVSSLTNIAALNCCMLLYWSLYSMVFIVVNGSPVFSCNGLESSVGPWLEKM